MRIGVMLRAYDRPGGIGIYSRNIVKHLLRLDSRNEYLLIYNNPAHLGTYRQQPNVEELYIPPGNPVLWDQWDVPRELKRRQVDLVFNTKFSLPLLTGSKRVMVLHGASWFVHPELYGKFDIFYVRRAMPVYCRAADFLIANSELTAGDFVRLLGVPPEKIQTVHLAAGEEFRVLREEAALAALRERYGLPGKFVLTVTSYDPRKNFGTLVNALEKCRRETDVRLVVAGKDCHRYAEDFQLKERGLEKAVHFLGWVDQRDLPGLYNLASAFVFPSIYEEFGIPVVEAMSCGCPVVSSSTGAIPDLVGKAGLLSPPFDDGQLAENLLRVLTSSSEAAEFRRLGLERATQFSWEKAARTTLDIFQRIVPERSASPQAKGRAGGGI